jgi:hypothetical protein
VRATEDAYDDIPYEEVSIEILDWSERGEYIRTRSSRKGPSEFDVEPEWATEAVMEPNRLLGSGRSQSAETVRVVGYSPAAGQLLTVVLLGKQEPVRGEWWGVNAWKANDRDERDYRKYQEKQNVHH